MEPPKLSVVNPIPLSPTKAPETPVPVNSSGITNHGIEQPLPLTGIIPRNQLITFSNAIEFRDNRSTKNSAVAKFYFIVLCIILLGMAIAPAVSAANRYSVASGNWNATSTWSTTAGGAPGASAPTAIDAVYIVGGFNVTITANASCASL